MEEHARIARKITIVLFLSQSLSSAGFIAAFTTNALVGAELSGHCALAGVPEAVRVLGQAIAALAWGYTMERIGRRRGLAIGQMVGTIANPPWTARQSSSALISSPSCSAWGL